MFEAVWVHCVRLGRIMTILYIAFGNKAWHKRPGVKLTRGRLANWTWNQLKGTLVRGFLYQTPNRKAYHTCGWRLLVVVLIKESRESKLVSPAHLHPLDKVVSAALLTPSLIPEPASSGWHVQPLDSATAQFSAWPSNMKQVLLTT